MAGFEDMMTEYQAEIDAWVPVVKRDGWGAIRYTAHDAHDGVAFSGVLTLGGAPVGSFEQQGDGGMTTFDFRGDRWYEVQYDKRAQTRALEAWKALGLDPRGDYGKEGAFLEAVLQVAGF